MDERSTHSARKRIAFIVILIRPHIFKRGQSPIETHVSS